eukprot:scaffold873_cov252-Pinguiococcus_pyrenoidosus.AAC.11
MDLVHADSEAILDGLHPQVLAQALQLLAQPRIVLSGRLPAQDVLQALLEHLERSHALGAGRLRQAEVGLFYSGASADKRRVS